MLEKFKSDYYFNSVYDIPFSFYEKHQIKALFVDLDNTLVEDEKRERPAHFEKWYAEVSNHGLELFIVSNNANRARVSEFMEELPIKWYHRANKQNGKVFQKIMDELHIRPEEVAVIGDRITTDIIAGKKVGALTVLTMPIIKDKNIFTRFIIRPLENALFVKKNNGEEKND